MVRRVEWAQLGVIDDWIHEARLGQHRSTRLSDCLPPTALTDTCLQLPAPDHVDRHVSATVCNCLQLSASGNSWVSERSHEIFVSDCLHPTTSRVCNCLHLATPGFLKGHTRFSKLLEGCPGCLNFAVRQLFFFEFCTERLSVVLFVYMTV